MHAKEIMKNTKKNIAKALLILTTIIICWTNIPKVKAITGLGDTPSFAEGVEAAKDEEIENPTMTDAQLQANQEAQCKAMGYVSCAEYAKANDSKTINNQKKFQDKLNNGQNYRFNLNSFSIKQKNGTTSGTSLFSSDYTKKYGVLVGTLLRVIDVLIYVIGSLALVTLIVAGIYMTINHGDESYVTRGKDMMLYSILGLLFALLAYALVAVIESALA